MKWIKLVKAEEELTNEQKQWFLEAKQKAKEIGSKYGYEIDCASTNPITKEKPIQTIWAAGGKYHPNITVVAAPSIIEKEVGATIQTVSFGYLPVAEYEKALEAYQKALACAKELENEFIK